MRERERQRKEKPREIRAGRRYLFKLKRSIKHIAESLANVVLCVYVIITFMLPPSVLHSSELPSFLWNGISETQYV